MDSSADRFISGARDLSAMEPAFEDKEDRCGGCCAAMFPPGRKTAPSSHAINFLTRLDLITASRRPRIILITGGRGKSLDIAPPRLRLAHTPQGEYEKGKIKRSAKKGWLDQQRGIR